MPEAAQHPQPAAVRRALEFVQVVARTDAMAPNEDGADRQVNRWIEEARQITGALAEDA